MVVNCYLDCQWFLMNDKAKQNIYGVWFLLHSLYGSVLWQKRRDRYWRWILQVTGALSCNHGHFYEFCDNFKQANIHFFCSFTLRSLPCSSFACFGTEFRRFTTFWRRSRRKKNGKKSPPKRNIIINPSSRRKTRRRIKIRKWRRGRWSSKNCRRRRSS